VIGFISLVLGLLGMALMRTRFPPERNVKLVLDVQGFRDVRFSLTAVAMFAIDFAVLIPPSYLTTYALANGVDSSLSYQPIPDTAQILGRSLPGFVVDRWGRFNIMIPGLSCAIAILAVWLTAGSSTRAIISFALLFGFFSGTAYSLTPVCLSQPCKTEEYGSKYGTAYGFVSIATLLGIPLSGAILNGQGGEDFQGLILICGLTYLTSTVIFFLERGVAVVWKSLKVF